MRTVYLLRHADANFNSSKDELRTLSKKGKDGINEITKLLEKLHFFSDCVYCSSATRTQQTLKSLEKKFDLGKVYTHNSLYNCSYNTILKIIEQTNDIYKQILIVGHNPSITNIFNYLTDSNTSLVPTCTIIKLTANVDSWEEVSHSSFREEWIIYPNT